MLWRPASASLAQLRIAWLLPMLAWLPAFLGPSIPALAQDVILLSESLAG